MAALIILTPLQLIVGDAVGTEVYQHQPLKTAAMEGVWNTQRGAPFLVFAIPDQEAQKNLFSIKIPHIAALLNTHQWNGELIGLKTVPKSDQPFVAFVFYSFRVMVGLGLLMFLLALIAVWLRRKKTLYEKRWFLRTCLFTSPIGFIALWCGWITAETGRQPWIVYGLLRTNNAASKVALSNVIISFVLIILIYGIIFGYFYFRYLRKTIRKGPQLVEPEILDQPFSYMPPTDKKEKP